MISFFAGLSPAFAQSQFFWDATSPIDNSPGSGGTGNWNTNAGNTVWWVSGGSDSVWTNGSIANFDGTAGTVTVNTPVTANGLTFATTGYTIGGTSNLTLSTATITLPDGGTETINAPLAGTTTVTVSPTTSGPSTLILGGTNTYTGATSISSSATLTIAGAGKLNNGAYAGNITDNGAFIYDSSAAQTLSGTLSGGGALTQEGAGLLTLTHANTTFTGGTTINPGSTLQLNVVAGAGSQTTISNNGTLNLNATGAANYAFSVVGGSSSVINLTMAYSTASENLRFPGPGTLSGFGGTINLIALNSTGGTNGGTFGAGQLILSVDSTILTSPGTWNIYAGATLDIVTPATPSTANVIINGPGNSQPNGALRLDAVNQTGNVLLNGSGITIGDGNNSAPSQISGNISDGGNNYGFTKVDAPETIILSGANTYTGPTIFSLGTLQADSAEIAGVSGPFGKSAAVNPGSIVLSGGILQYSSINSNDYSGRFSTNTGQAYNIDVNGQTVTFASPLTSSSGALTLKDTAGGGILTLSGTNTYNGITTINTGTLNISGSIAGTVITANGGTLELSRPTALPSGAILTLPSSPADSMVNLNFTGTQNITTLNFGSTSMPPGTYGSPTNSNVLYQNAAFTGNGVINVQPPIYWDPGFSDASPGSGGNGSWDSISTNWFSGNVDAKWVSNNVANFAGTAGTVTLNANETADGLTFVTDGYTIGGTSSLTLAGTPIISGPGVTAEIDCSIAGTAGLTESGLGTLTLGGSNSFTGSTTIGDGSTLVLRGTNVYTGATTIGNSSTLTISTPGNLAGGAYPGNIANGGALIYNSSASQTLAGIISGSGGTLTQDGPGPLTLSGLNTYTGATTINSGTLTIAGSGDLGNNVTFNTGSYSGTINDMGAFVYNSSAQQTLSGGISDSGLGGTLTQNGSGALTLSGFNTYIGATTIGSNSVLAISGSGVLGGGDYETNLVDNGTFTYGSFSGQTLSGTISGTGMLTLTSSSFLILSGTNTYTGATTIGSSCTLTISDPGNLGNGAYAANITNTGSLLYNSSVNQTLSGVISGAGGTLTQGGSGTLTLTGTNSYTGATTINQNSELIIGGSGDLGKGNYAGAVNNMGAFIYNSSANQTLSGGLSDSGSGGTLTENGPGTLVLTGPNSYLGTTTVGSNGILVVSGSSALNNGDYETNIVDNGTFAYNSSFAQTLGGVISGSGNLALSGATTLTLTAANTYAGATVISNGTLVLSGSGSISDSKAISIAAGATLMVSALSSCTHSAAPT